MKELKKILYLGLVLGIASLLCIQAGAISTMSKTVVNTPVLQNIGGNTLISVDNPDGDDFNPRICKGPGGIMVVVYEKQNDLFSKVVPVVWSDDGGETWTTQFEFDSIGFTEGSGLLQHPDIVYNSNIGVYFMAMVDPLASMYNNEMAFIPGDITTAEGPEQWYGISGSGSENYGFCAGDCTDNFFLSVTTEDGYGFTQLFGLGYFTYPDFEAPPTMGGFYYDGNSVHQSAPASDVEMDVGGNRIYITCETEGQITVKSTVNDEDLLTNGEQQNGMDKYADIEQYPGEYVGSGTDPDVASSGNHVCVVYVSGGNVVCSYSTNNAGTYDPGHSWQTSTVATGASAPSVFMSGANVFVGYVSGGNCYSVQSEDYGATWGDAVKVNEVDGTVVNEPGSVTICDAGIIWTDSRNGAKDLYTAAGAAEFPLIEIASISKGFGVKASITNTGTADAEAVVCEISIDAPLMILGKTTTATIDVAVGEEVSISTGFILGFGPASIKVTAGDASETISGTVLGPLVL